MASPINVTGSLASGAQISDWVILNRYGPTAYFFSVVLGGTGTYTIEGTNARLNRGDSAVAFSVDDASNVPIEAQTATKFWHLDDLPLEAVRLNVSASNDAVTFHVTQQGGSG